MEKSGGGGGESVDFTACFTAPSPAASQLGIASRNRRFFFSRVFCRFYWLNAPLFPFYFSFAVVKCAQCCNAGPWRASQVTCPSQVIPSSLKTEIPHQKFKYLKIQKFENSKIQKFKYLKIQKFENSKIQKFKNSKIQKIQNSKIQKKKNETK